MSIMPTVLRRRRGDPLPGQPAAVVLVPLDGPASQAAIARAVEAAGDGKVAVVALLRIHGSSFGFPNPGLLPTAAEKKQARQVVEQTIKTVERHGAQADGQITATRKPAKMIVGAARRRSASLVIIDGQKRSRNQLRRILEGDLAATVRHRLDGQAAVEEAGS